MRWMVAEVNRGASSGLRLQINFRLLLSTLVLERRSHPFDSTQGRFFAKSAKDGALAGNVGRKIPLSGQFASMR